MALEKKRFSVGLRDNCPFHNLTLGAQSFPRYTEKPVRDDDTGRTQRFRRMGGVLNLTDEQAVKVKAAIDRKVVRWLNTQKTRAILANKDEQPEEADEPIAKYVWFRPMEAVERDPWETPPADAAEASAAEEEEELERAKPGDAAHRVAAARAKRAGGRPSGPLFGAPATAKAPPAKPPAAATDPLGAVAE